VTTQQGRVDYIDPDEIPKSPGFTNAVAVTGPVKTIYIGAQTATGPDGATVGKGDIGQQSEQVLRNLKACLAAAGAGLEHLIQWTIYLVQGHDVMPGFQAFQREWRGIANPPANTVLFVAGFPNPEWLVAIEAVAVVPLDGDATG
jgi:enamine deaminase RidA (YjgF/YER057c/UK114 family)